MLWWWILGVRVSRGWFWGLCADLGRVLVGLIARRERDLKPGFVENDGGADGRTEFARVHSVSEFGVVAEGAASFALRRR